MGYKFGQRPKRLCHSLSKSSISLQNLSAATASILLCLFLLLVQLYIRVVDHFLTNDLYLSVSFLSNLLEQFRNVRSIFSADLVKSHPVGISQLLPLFWPDFPSLSQIALVAYHEDGNLRTRVLVDLLEPVLDIGKGVPVVNGVGQNNDECSLVKGVRQIFELFLTSSIPNLQLDFVLVDLYGFYFEVDADSRGIGWLEAVIAVAHQNVGLSHSAVSDYNCFYDVVAVGCFLSRLHFALNIGIRQIIMGQTIYQNGVIQYLTMQWKKQV